MELTLQNKVNIDQIKSVARALQLSPENYDRLVEAAQLRPDRKQWKHWFDRFLLIIGTMFVLTGLVSFMAYNWSELHKFIKFAVLQSALILSVAMSWYKGLDRLPGRAFLFSAAILVGINLAVFGQAYQTGADPYGLFLGWSILILGWALVGRQIGLYVLIAILANLALIFYWVQIVDPLESIGMAGVFGPLFSLFISSGKSQLPIILLGLNFIFICSAEYFHRRVKYLSGYALTRTAGVMALIPLTSSSIRGLFSRNWLDESGLIFSCFACFVGLGLWYFRYRKRDLFLSAAILLSIIVFISTAFGRILSGTFRIGSLTLFWVAIIVLLQTYGAAVWLRQTQASTRGSR